MSLALFKYTKTVHLNDVCILSTDLSLDLASCEERVTCDIRID
jgi:hypothetical protein